MIKPRFSLRDLLWSVLVCGLVVGWMVNDRTWERKLANIPHRMPQSSDPTGWLLMDLEDPIPKIRAAAMDLLAKRKCREAIPKIIPLLDDPGIIDLVHMRRTYCVCDCAWEVLRYMTGKSIPRDSNRWRDWWETNREQLLNEAE